MNRIERLLAELAPDGVPYRPLGQIGEFVRGSGLQKADLTGEGVPAIHYGEIHTHYGVWADQTKSFTTPELAAKLRKAEPGDVVLATTSEDDQAVGKATAWIGQSNAVISGDAFIFRHSQDPKFVSYFLGSDSFQTQKTRFVSGAKVRRISGSSLEKIVMPTPPLEVQREIVRILDKFTALEAELEAELEARLVQYAHFREQLFENLAPESTPHRRMEEIGQFMRGKRFTKADFVAEGVPCIHYGEIYTHYGTSARSTRSFLRPEISDGLRFAQPGEVVIAGVSETVDDVAKATAWLGDGPIAIHDDSFAFTSDLNPVYVAHLMQTARFHEQKERHVSRGKMKRIGAKGLGQIIIPVPAESEQRRIVSALDTFDELVADISVGLPGEIAARRKQYEYYRDKLLTFKEAS